MLRKSLPFAIQQLPRFSDVVPGFCYMCQVPYEVSHDGEQQHIRTFSHRTISNLLGWMVVDPHRHWKDPRRVYESMAVLEGDGMVTVERVFSMLRRSDHERWRTLYHSLEYVYHAGAFPVLSSFKNLEQFPTLLEKDRGWKIVDLEVARIIRKFIPYGNNHTAMLQLTTHTVHYFTRLYEILRLRDLAVHQHFPHISAFEVPYFVRILCGELMMNARSASISPEIVVLSQYCLTGLVAELFHTSTEHLSEQADLARRLVLQAKCNFLSTSGETTRSLACERHGWKQTKASSRILHQWEIWDVVRYWDEDSAFGMVWIQGHAQGTWTGRVVRRSAAKGYLEALFFEGQEGTLYKIPPSNQDVIQILKIWPIDVVDVRKGDESLWFTATRSSHTARLAPSRRQRTAGKRGAGLYGWDEAEITARRLANEERLQNEAKNNAKKAFTTQK